MPVSCGQLAHHPPLWVYYSAQILLFGAEFTQVYATNAGRRVIPTAQAERLEKAASPARLPPS